MADADSQADNIFGAHAPADSSSIRGDTSRTPKQKARVLRKKDSRAE
jgi:hypothetical protein